MYVKRSAARRSDNPHTIHSKIVSGFLANAALPLGPQGCSE